MKNKHEINKEQNSDIDLKNIPVEKIVLGVIIAVTVLNLLIYVLSKIGKLLISYFF